MTLDRADIRFEPEEFVEDRTWCGEGFKTWTDLVWRDFRLERGHSMDDREMALMVNGRYVTTVRSIRKAKGEILDILEE